MNPRDYLLESFLVAVKAADPAHIIPQHLPSPPKGRTLVVGAGKAAVPEEAPTIAFAFASVTITKPVRVGEELTEDNIFPMRPAGGDFGVVDYEGLIGKRAARDLEADVQLRHGDI